MCTSIHYKREYQASLSFFMQHCNKSIGIKLLWGEISSGISEIVFIQAYPPPHECYSTLSDSAQTPQRRQCNVFGIRKKIKSSSFALRRM